MTKTHFTKNQLESKIAANQIPTDTVVISDSKPTEMRKDVLAEEGLRVKHDMFFKAQVVHLEGMIKCHLKSQLSAIKCQRITSAREAPYALLVCQEGSAIQRQRRKKSGKWIRFSGSRVSFHFFDYFYKEMNRRLFDFHYLLDFIFLLSVNNIQSRNLSSSDIIDKDLGCDIAMELPFFTKAVFMKEGGERMESERNEGFELEKFEGG
ncbi:hypothetical protein Acr_06g0001130 [Actinidia rufa]|uniref:Uncharacterized protein n=1 Tax=Actinidia rufa TaxID=165716 RepID=A0A7J0ENU7_9ERIC|nr:hypothetical protein Acr_06g0001130 [Actinidia rufa]